MVEIGNIVQIKKAAAPFVGKKGAVVKINGNKIYLHMFDVITDEDFGFLPAKTGYKIEKESVEIIETPINKNYLLISDSKTVFFQGNDEIIENLVNKIFKTTDNDKILVYECEKIRSYKRSLELKKAD